MMSLRPAFLERFRGEDRAFDFLAKVQHNGGPHEPLGRNLVDRQTIFEEMGWGVHMGTRVGEATHALDRISFAGHDPDGFEDREGGSWPGGHVSLEQGG